MEPLLRVPPSLRCPVGRDEAAGDARRDATRLPDRKVGQVATDPGARSLTGTGRGVGAHRWPSRRVR